MKKVNLVNAERITLSELEMSLTKGGSVPVKPKLCPCICAGGEEEVSDYNATIIHNAFNPETGDLQ